MSYPGTPDGRPVLRDVEWRIGPGERTGIVGANGAGKSTLLGLIAGTIVPDSGRVKRGKTVRLGMLDQQSGQLAEIADDLVRDVLGRLKTGYQVDGKELTPAQVLERLGFRREQLSARVGELSGGQRRRLQLMLTLFDEPNVLVLDEPTNDVDIDMLSATEDLLDSWPGTLIVVSRPVSARADHRPAVRRARRASAAPSRRYRRVPADDRPAARRRSVPGRPNPSTRERLSGAELRNIEKEIAALDRALVKLSGRVNAKHVELAEHDQSDHVGLARLTRELRELEADVADKESRWLQLSELVESGG